MARERDVRPAAGYLGRAEARQGGEFVTPQMRSIVTSWLSEVAGEFGMQQETLFLAVALLDRFQACSPAVRAGGSRARSRRCVQRRQATIVHGGAGAAAGAMKHYAYAEGLESFLARSLAVAAPQRWPLGGLPP
jgi:hypothetical protein